MKGPSLPHNPKELVRQKEEEVRLAIEKTYQEFRENLSRVFSLTAWVQQKPWPSLGTIALVGFIVGSQTLDQEKEGEKREGSALAEKAASLVKSSLFPSLSKVISTFIRESVKTA